MFELRSNIGVSSERATVVGGETGDRAVHWSWAAILADPARLEVLRALCELGTATTAELRERCHCSDPTVRRHLDALESLGLVREQAGERDGLTPGRPARRYTLGAETAARVCALFRLLMEPLVPIPAPGPPLPPLPGRGPEPCTRPPAPGKAAAPSFRL